MGCEWVQGYYFTQPLPAGALAAWIRARDEDALAHAAPAGVVAGPLAGR